MSTTVFLPPATDDGDELGRWYDAGLWAEVYVKEREMAERAWLDWLIKTHRYPEMKDYPSVLDWCAATERDE